jgi:hypothetical protein
VTRIANSVSGTVKAVHVLEQCCEDVRRRGRVTEGGSGTCYSDNRKDNCDTPFTRIQYLSTEQSVGQSFKTENDQFLSSQH